MRRSTLLFALLLTACGQKGPLYLPPEQSSAPPADEPAPAPNPEQTDVQPDSQPNPDPR